jgi:hypothetical protein
MSAPRYAALARKLLVRVDVAAREPSPSPQHRASAIQAIEGAINARRRRRRAWRWAGGAAAVAAVLACALGTSHYVLRTGGSTAPVATVPGTGNVQIVAHPAAGGASVVVSGAQAPLVEGRALTSGSRIVTPANGRATLSFSTGTSVSIGEAADLSVVDEGESQRLRLAGGSVDLHVAKLGQGQRFVVDTPDTEVEVRGTRFRVAMVDGDPTCSGGVATRVTVSEGVVVVRHAGVEDRVEAGAQWPRGCSRPGTTATAASSRSPVAASGAHPQSAARSAGSELAAQNDMFAEASMLKRLGDVPGALSEFERLLSKYPGGPLAESASVERMRLLKTVAPERATASAREYLARYPTGFARTEAESLVQAGVQAGP